MLSFQQFIVESDDFVLAWNQYTAKHPKEMRPIPVEFKRFSKISNKKPPVGLKRSCYLNALTNYQNSKGLKLVIGFAVPESDAQKLIKTGEMSWNPLYRGYTHAWNLDKDGGIVDSTYRDEAKDYRYYGFVVPEVTAKSFRDDSDVESYAHNKEDAHEHPRRLDYEKAMMKYTGDSKHYSIQAPLPPPFSDILKKKGFKYHSVQSTDSRGYQSYLYLNNRSAKLYLMFDPKEKRITHVNYIPMGPHGEGLMQTWAKGGLYGGAWDRWVDGEKPDQRKH